MSHKRKKRKSNTDWDLHTPTATVHAVHWSQNVMEPGWNWGLLKSSQS